MAGPPITNADALEQLHEAQVRVLKRKLSQVTVVAAVNGACLELLRSKRPRRAGAPAGARAWP